MGGALRAVHLSQRLSGNSKGGRRAASSFAAAPDGILHTAAISDTGYCADHPEQAYRANVELPVWLARAAAEIGAKLVAFSSDQVYAGVEQSGPLPETIPLKPANVYGQGKLEMEQRVQALCPGAVLLRATWMYDLPGYRLPIRATCR